MDAATLKLARRPDQQKDLIYTGIKRLAQFIRFPIGTPHEFAALCPVVAASRSMRVCSSVENGTSIPRLEICLQSVSAH